jgi:hypothetical protein
VNKGIFLIFIFLSSSAYALVPLEGLILGDVQGIKQFDPLSKVHTKNSIPDKSKLNDFELERFKKYIGLYRQGANLKFSCDYSSKPTYATSWNEAQAKRTIVSTLQYIGLDTSMKAIVKYMKLLEYSEEEFNNLSDNLITNTCSKNLSVYSLKLLKLNFKHLYKVDSLNTFELPTIMESPFYSKRIKEKSNTRLAKKNELSLSIKNFRSFCSWGGDTDNYRMLSPYLKNPYVMSFIYNQLLEKSIVWNNDNKTIEYKKSNNTVKVVCEDLICRKSSNVKFLQKFPRMIGSTDLEIDFTNLYCGHFQKVNYESKGQNSQIKKWINNTTEEESLLEAMNFTALITGIPDLLMSSEKFSDLKIALKENIKSRWDKWAKEKSQQFVSDLLYEESLNIDLVSMIDSTEIYKGNFQLIFDFTLSEMDRELSVVDKITSNFNLHFPKSYLRWIRDDYIKKNNKSDFEGLMILKQKLVSNINGQLLAKKKLFLIPLWNEKMGEIITGELIEQLISYKGNYFADFSHQKMNIPVKFRFGLFALKYLNEKFKTNYRKSNALSLTLKK